MCRECGRATGQLALLYLRPNGKGVYLCRRSSCIAAYNGVSSPADEQCDCGLHAVSQAPARAVRGRRRGMV